MNNVKRIDHVAIVVDDIEAALGFWRDGLGLEVTHVEDVPDQESVVAFLPTGDSEVELVKPTTSAQRRGPLPGSPRTRHSSHLLRGRPTWSTTCGDLAESWGSA